MIDFVDSQGKFARRQFLRLGGFGCGALAWPGLWSNAEAAAAKSALTGKSVVFLFMQGGPTQFETFDPKMTAPVGIRSATGEISTSIPGVTFGSSFPKLAKLADQLAIVRSFTTGDGNHDIKPIVGKNTAGANLGSWYSRVAGTNHPQTGMPSNALLFPRAVDETTGPEQKSFGRFDSTGQFGSGYAPFVPGAGGDFQQDMKLKIPVERLGHRQSLLSSLDQARWTLDRNLDSDPSVKLRDQAFSTILGGVAGAFDLSREDPRTIARYDTAPLVRPNQISRKWNNYNHYVDNAKSLGKLMLLARRLCEAGCGFVTVTTNFVWDMHADSNNATMEEGMRYLGVPFDHAVSAFLEDLADRRLSDKILLVCCGEMGRTPRINNRGGRDHWGGLAPLLLAGGGWQMGQVIGHSSRDGSRPQSTPVTNQHLTTSVLQTLFDVSELRLSPSIPGEIIKAASDTPIPGLR